MANDHIDSLQYKDALRKYTEAFVSKKRGDEGAVEKEPLFVIYARKSTEDENRQVQSIEDQIERCQEHARKHNLKIVHPPIIEEKSAKIAGKRTNFERLINGLYKGDSYNSVLAWHPDRLSRNMKESGEILDMLDNGVIVDLKFASYAFNNDAAGKMTLSILFAMAKEFSDKLSDDTKRGIRKKVSDGKYVGTSKRGYINSSNDFFRRDPDTFELYKTAWQKYLSSGNQAEAARWLAEHGEEIDSKRISDFFRDPFYAGMYWYGTQIVDLQEVDPKFEPMVTPRDFVTMEMRNKGSSERMAAYR